MGCNCKKAQRIEKKYPEFSKKELNKKGINKILNIIKNIINRLIGTVIIILLCLILLPIIFVIIIYSFMFNGKMSLKLPNLSKLLKKNKE
jgi:uncharacterized membrane protein